MRPLYSQRTTQPPVEYTYAIPMEVRRRILYTLTECAQNERGWAAVLGRVGQELLKAYGSLRGPSYEAARQSEHPVLEHFYRCPEEEVVDFLEACFRDRVYVGDQACVNEINTILDQCGIGFSFTAYIERRTRGKWRGRMRALVEHECPQALRRDHQFLHREVTEPTLHLLADSRFRVANDEMLRAHRALRGGDYAKAITLTGSAFESTLKTVCGIQEWAYDPDRDTCAKLITICQDHGLFPPFYTSVLGSSCTVRNKLGDTHGRGPDAPYPATKHEAEHMLHMTSANILLLTRRVDLD